ncbi:unnamed protein product [Phyllotreta striolata]|uniref:Neuropeptide-like 1 n=1 Tax=Phyllotreta striolata TaxID=444603 RepID=A0A9N9TUS6_PHYSR|nr:unnamed protein product [Phyllotreta striolata]
MHSAVSMNFAFGILVFLLGVYKVSTYDIDGNQVLEELLSPQENPSIQVRALRRELLKKVQEAIDRLDDEEGYQALMRLNGLPDKRNLEALARAGYIKTMPEEEEDDANYKRSIANLAKNGQLPRQADEQKRGLESLARNGDLHSRNVQTLWENLADKRHLGSIIKNYDVPPMSKKSLSSLAKAGDLNRKHAQYKRSPQAGSGNRLSNAISKQSSGDLRRLFDDKNGMGAARGKREADYYYDENYTPVYQNAYDDDDDDDVIRDLHQAYPGIGKRFLGSAMRSGFRPTASAKSGYPNPEKKHIGSLARLGWLPTFRHIRRFNRSGRSSVGECRASSSNGEAQVDGDAQNASILLKSSDGYSYKSPGESAYLKRIFYHPNVSKFY